MKNPYFSVIIPTFNRYDFLMRAIESVLLQTESDFEIIIVDDGSTDNTASLVKSICDKRLVYIHQTHKGVSCTRNLGISCAKAQIIAFLDSDDRFKPEKLKIAKQYTENYPNFKIFHTEEIWYRNQKLLNQKKIHKKPQGDVFVNSLKLCCIGMSTAVVKKELFDKIGNFDESFQACEDYELWLRAASLYPVKLIPQALTIKQGGHPDQLSKKFPAMDTFRIAAIDKLLKNRPLTKAQKEHAVKELKLKCTIYIKGALKRNKLKEALKYENLMHFYDKK